MKSIRQELKELVRKQLAEYTKFVRRSKRGGREDLKSGGWPGLPCGDDWKATCACGQPLLIVSPPNAVGRPTVITNPDKTNR
jgi:hypothetical protein